MSGVFLRFSPLSLILRAIPPLEGLVDQYNIIAELLDAVPWDIVVLSPAEQAEEAVEAGAKFIVSPGLSQGVANVCKVNKLPYYPGCVTPTEIMQALELGIDIIKFFPAGVYGGLKALKALSGPFPQVKFIPTGGVNLDNLEEFLSFDKIYAVGGSFMMKGDITENCKQICEVVSKHV